MPTPDQHLNVPERTTSSSGLPAYVSLRPSELGGQAVYFRSEFIGWMHSSDALWKAYLRQPDHPLKIGLPLGTFTQEEAAAQIVRAYKTTGRGWPDAR